jgi:hypothetical protein
MQRWMVLDEAGEQVAEVRVPMNVQVMHIGTDAIWGLEPDELGAPYIVRYRIDR